MRAGDSPGLESRETGAGIMTEVAGAESPVHVYQEIDSIDQGVSKGWLMRIDLNTQFLNDVINTNKDAPKLNIKASLYYYTINPKIIT